MPCLLVNGFSVPCKGILFDKDGTLLDMMALWGGWAEAVLAELNTLLAASGAGFQTDPAKVLGTVHDRSGAVIGCDPAGPMQMATAEETYGLLAWQLYAAGMPWDEASLRVREAVSRAMEELRRKKQAAPLPGLLPFLDQCAAASLKLGVVTSDDARGTLEHLEWLGIASRFRTVVTRDRVRDGKPAPEMAVTACRALGLEPAETVVIGDSNADMLMGKAAGLAYTVGIMAPDGSSRHLLDADAVIRSFDDLAIIKGDFP